MDEKTESRDRAAMDRIGRRIFSWVAIPASLIAIAIVAPGVPSEIRRQNTPEYRKDLPSSATDPADLGGGWQSFRLDTGGRPRRFLRHVERDGHDRIMAEAVVEVRD
jgi:hypothetical protein